MAKLIKITDTRFGGNHPNNINEGYETTSDEIELPVVGDNYRFGNLTTSTVTIVSEKDDKIIFNTLNSVYEIIK